MSDKAVILETLKAIQAKLDDMAKDMADIKADMRELEAFLQSKK